MSAHVIPDELFAKMSSTEAYMCSHLLVPDPALSNTLLANSTANLDSIDVAPNEGKLLYLLAKMNGARHILEIGTLGGYSAIWLAKALPTIGPRKVVTLEVEEEHAYIAKKNIAAAGLTHLIDVRVGSALDTLESMASEGWGKEDKVFDMVFIDADKKNNVGYIKWALKFSRKGTVIVVDNVGRKGKILDEMTSDETIQGVRATFEMLGKEKRIDATAIQTVGSKGWDGFALALVVD
jgi:predicted O-methyltransferase YrrM